MIFITFGDESDDIIETNRKLFIGAGPSDQCPKCPEFAPAEFENFSKIYFYSYSKNRSAGALEVLVR